MPSVEAMIVATAAFVVFAYHALGAFVLIGGVQPLPFWLRKALLPRKPATGILRGMSIIWVVGASVISQLVVIWALSGRGRNGGVADSLVLAGELGLALLWLAIIGARWRSIGN